MISIQQKSYDGNNVTVLFRLLKDEGYFYLLTDYKIPINWIFIQLTVLFLIGDFFFQDLGKNRTYLLLRSRLKGRYILSKIVWMIVQSFVFFAGIFIVIYIVSSLVFGDFSLTETSYLKQIIGTILSPEEFILRILLGYFVTTIALSAVLLLCMQFIPPVVAYFAVIAVSCISTFADMKWLPAIHSMILKQAIFAPEHQLTLRYSLTYSILLFAFASLATYFVFKKKDIF
ncbi:hypothetical protein J9303_15825 [Bacillaceae bacterium Marseille-Q3522]|nr:hypothetical protein [Bacillaceae bacterium Marseille-Q3522]